MWLDININNPKKMCEEYEGITLEAQRQDDITEQMTTYNIKQKN